VMLACGGWSVRQPSFARLAPIGGAGGVVPKVRAVYVHPCFARKGLGRHLMNFIEAEIVRAGFTRATLMSTLTALPLYRALGYRGDAPVILSLPGGHPFVGIAMEKRLDCGGVRRAA
jgi:GNAT superfamily N-acetyltransferase